MSRHITMNTVVCTRVREVRGFHVGDALMFFFDGDCNFFDIDCSFVFTLV